MNHLIQKICLPPEIEAALNNGASLVISISGGKDSDAMCELLPILHKARGWTGKLALVHADLQDSEWSMTSGYVHKRAQELGLPLHIVTRERGTLLDQMQQRHAKRPDVPPFPSAAARYCTSDHKRTPIDTFCRQFQPIGTIICAIGIRAEESAARSRKPVFRLRESVTTRDRIAYDWHPLFDFTVEDIWQTLGLTQAELKAIREKTHRLLAAGCTLEQAVWETRFRWNPVYTLGNERLSCSICVLASQNDLLNGIEFHPDHYRRLVQLEIDSGFSFRQGLWLGDLRPDLLTNEQRERLQQVRDTPPERKQRLSTAPRPVQLCFDAFLC